VKAPRFFDLTERMIYLRSIPVASMLPAPVLKIIASSLSERQFAQGEILMKEGAPISGLHLLTEGKISLVRKGHSFGTLSPPQSLGFLGILARQDGTYHATADLPTRTLELPADVLMELMEDHFEFLHATTRYLSERLLYELQEMPASALESRLDGVDAVVPENRELDLVERVVWLRALTAFTKTNLNALAAMAKQMNEQRLVPGARLWTTGDNSDHALFVVAGRGRCEAPDGRIWRAGPTSVCGGMEGMANKPRWYSMIAETPMVTFRAPIGSFIEVLEDDFGLAQSFTSRIASDLIGLLERKAVEGKVEVNVPRNVTNLGVVPVGA
jgi:CRP-like cAMP-binding protein